MVEGKHLKGKTWEHQEKIVPGQDQKPEGQILNSIGPCLYCGVMWAPKSVESWDPMDLAPEACMACFRGFLWLWPMVFWADIPCCCILTSWVTITALASSPKFHVSSQRLAAGILSTPRSHGLQSFLWNVSECFWDPTLLHSACLRNQPYVVMPRSGVNSTSGQTSLNHSCNSLWVPGWLNTGKSCADAACLRSLLKAKSFKENYTFTPWWVWSHQLLGYPQQIFPLFLHEILYLCFKCKLGEFIEIEKRKVWE